MGNRTSLCSLCLNHSHSSFFFYFPSLSLSLSLANTDNLYSWQVEIALIEPSVCVDSRDYSDDWSYFWASCFQNILISFSEIKQMT